MKELDWQKPEDTDPNSTNCLLNAYANKIHEKTYGYNPYVWEIANMVREGVMTREDGLKSLQSLPRPDRLSRSKRGWKFDKKKK